MKLLTVDDSKTVRIIVRKAFKGYDLNILEAANGVEGLAIAAKEMPDLILLDVTMPVMDGIEMLTKLKSNPLVKNIPVIMLTAEGGRDTVLKIAKIGVRDYMVKPFKEDVLLDKVGRILDLKLVGEEVEARRTILDKVQLLMVEDKPAIVEQVREGLKHTPWEIHHSTNTWNAVDFAQNNTVDLFLVSLNLPEDSSFELIQILRSNRKTKSVPVLAMVVKTDKNRYAKAQQMGFSGIVTKPLEMLELEARVARCMNLDMSPRYYNFEQKYMVIRFPEKPSGIDLSEISNNLSKKLSEAVDSGLSRIIIDLQDCKSLEVGIIKQVLQITQSCRDLSLEHALVGNDSIVEQGQSFEETKNWKVYQSIESAEELLQVPVS